MSSIDDLVPAKGGPRTTVRVLAAIAVIAILAISFFMFAVAALDGKVAAKTKPLRIKQAEDSAVLDHIFEDMEEFRDQKGVPRHRLEDIREQAREKALKDEKYRTFVEPE
jgi:hypothetical protein